MEHKHARRRAKREVGGDGAVFLIKKSLMGALVSIGIMLVLSLSLAGVAYKNADPDALVGLFSFAALYISAFVAGIASAKLAGRDGVVSGALGGLMLVAILFVISVCLGDAYAGSSSWGATMALRASVVAISALGGFIGGKKSNTRKRKRKRS